MRVPALLLSAAAVVAGGVATNQVLDNGRFSSPWLYVAFGCAVLAIVFGLYTTPAESRAGRRMPRIRRRVYLRQLRASVTDMETIGLATQGEFVLGMRQVYVDVALRPRPAWETVREPKAGHAEHEHAGERRPLSSFLDPGRVLAIIGNPGSGKTTLVRHTALDLCGGTGKDRLRRSLRNGIWRRRQVPVLLYLRDHSAEIVADETPSLPEVAVETGWLHGKVPASWVRDRLDAGRCAVLLDGLDEIADEADRKRAVAWVRRQIERYPGNAFVVTSRPHGYASNPIPNADVLQVQRFTAAQIARFLHHWFYAMECRARSRSGAHVRVLSDAKARDLLTRLRTKPALYELAANPLLLTMIANVHRYRGALPGSRADLYEEMCDVLLHLRQEAKNLTDPTGLTGKKKERVVRQLAMHMMRGRLRDIPIPDARRAIARTLRQVSAGRQITPAVFLEEVRKSGLIVEREHGLYGFAHLTLQEYLAATHIREQPARHLHLLTDGVDDPWWRETTLLWAAEADATPVIDACLTSGTIRALTLAFDCAEEALEADPGALDRLDDLLAAPEAPEARDARDAAQAPQASQATSGATAERLRLSAAVTAARTLREVVWLDDTTAICAQPVTPALWRLFSRQGSMTTADGPKAIGPRGALHRRPAVCDWVGDAGSFVRWLNALFDDGETYRLPTPDEARQAGTRLPELDRRTVWTAAGDLEITLVPLGAAPWPYAQPEHRRAGFRSDIIRHFQPVMTLVELDRGTGSMSCAELLTFTHLLAAVDPPYSPSQRSVLMLARLIDLVVARADNDPSSETSRSALTRAEALGRALGLHPLDLDNGANLRARLNRAIDEGLAEAADSISSTTGGPDRRDEFPDPFTAPLRRARQHAGSPGLPRSFNRLFNTALDHQRSLHNVRVRVPDLGPSPPSPLRYLVADELGLGVIPNTVPVQGQGAGPRLVDRDTFRAYETARLFNAAHLMAADLGPHYKKLLPVIVDAYRVIMRCLPSAANATYSLALPGARAPSDVPPSLRRFLDGLVLRCASIADSGWPNPTAVLREVLQRIGEPEGLTSIRHHSGREPDTLRDDGRRLIQHALDLITPDRARSTPCDRAHLTVAAIALVAAMAHLRANAQADLADELAPTLNLLICVTDEPLEQDAPRHNQTLLLVRT